MNEKKKKSIAQFVDLFDARDEIIKHSSKNLPTYQYPANLLAQELHPDSFSVQLVKIVNETNDIKSFWFTRESKENFPPFLPGSYITLQVEIDGRIYKRAYSISSSSNSLKEYRITVKKAGIVSRYLFSSAKEGNIFLMEGPFGDFHYQSLRDRKEVIFLVGGSFLAGCYPMILDCLENHKIQSLSLIYGTKTVNDILWKKELDDLQKKYKNFHVTYVLSEEKRDDYAFGFISEELILKESYQGKSFFISGPQKMYEHLNPILKSLDVPNELVHHEIFATKPEDLASVKHNLTVHYRDETYTIPCYENETLFTSMEKNRVLLKVCCTVGVCGFCKSKLLSGEVKTDMSGLRHGDITYHFIHPCVTYPLSDIVLEIF